MQKTYTLIYIKNESKGVEAIYFFEFVFVEETLKMNLIKINE